MPDVQVSYLEALAGADRRDAVCEDSSDFGGATGGPARLGSQNGTS